MNITRKTSQRSSFKMLRRNLGKINICSQSFVDDLFQRLTALSPNSGDVALKGGARCPSLWTDSVAGFYDRPAGDIDPISTNPTPCTRFVFCLIFLSSIRENRSLQNLNMTVWLIFPLCYKYISQT